MKKLFTFLSGLLFLIACLYTFGWIVHLDKYDVQERIFPGALLLGICASVISLVIGSFRTKNENFSESVFEVISCAFGAFFFMFLGVIALCFLWPLGVWGLFHFLVIYLGPTMTLIIMTFVFFIYMALSPKPFGYDMKEYMRKDSRMENLMKDPSVQQFLNQSINKPVLVPHSNQETMMDAEKIIAEFIGKLKEEDSNARVLAEKESREKSYIENKAIVEKKVALENEVKNSIKEKPKDDAKNQKITKKEMELEKYINDKYGNSDVRWDNMARTIEISKKEFDKLGNGVLYTDNRVEDYICFVKQKIINKYGTKTVGWREVINLDDNAYENDELVKYLTMWSKAYTNRINHLKKINNIYW